jgi:kynureninase
VNSQEFARQLDDADPLTRFRGEFAFPTDAKGAAKLYFVGNSLGLMPKKAREYVENELDAWAQHAVDAHFMGEHPWYSYHEVFREAGARLVGARPGEVVMMNSLSVNLHLMMVTFFRPTKQRWRILTDWPTFPSDLYAIKTQLRHHGLNPDDALLFAKPLQGEHCVRSEHIEDIMEEHGDEVALILMNGVNFITGQAFDMQRITELGHGYGAVVGFDLAHAAGNLHMQLHDWNVDFACWCSYKYVNAGPGAVAGCFVHELHGKNTSLPRFGGWWGNDPDTRFQMHLQPEFLPRAGADGWQLSNPPILAMAPLRASLELFDSATLPALRAKSITLTSYLRWLIESLGDDVFEIITPTEPDSHGCQLSILVHDQAQARFRAMEQAGVVCDFRPPNVIRLAPVPLYNSFTDVWRVGQTLASTTMKDRRG